MSTKNTANSEERTIAFDKWEGKGQQNGYPYVLLNIVVLIILEVMIHIEFEYYQWIPKGSCASYQSWKL